MSFLAWMLGLAAYDAVSHAVDAVALTGIRRPTRLPPETPLPEGTKRFDVTAPLKRVDLDASE